MQEAVGWHDPQPWMPCPRHAWCGQYHERFSATLVNKQLPHIFASDSGESSGLVVGNGASHWCSYMADGGTMSKQCKGRAGGCIDGCTNTDGHPNWCSWQDAWSTDPGASVYECSFKAKDLKAMLQRQLERNANSYNEVVLDTSRWGADQVEAFFYVPFGLNAAEAERNARDVYTQFRRKYPDRHAPLVTFNPEPGDGVPFALVEPHD